MFYVFQRVILFATLAGLAVVLVHCFTDGVQEAKIESKKTTNTNEQQASIAFINDDLWDGRKVAHNIRILDKEISDLPDNQGLRQKKIEQFAQQFLLLEMSVESFVQNRSTDDVFILYLRALASRIQKYGGSEDDVVEFFFEGLQKYKTLCLMDIPDAMRLDDKTLVEWDESLQWLRGSLYDNLNNIERHLFDSYLIGISEEARPKVRAIFSEFYVCTTQELARVELEHSQRRYNQKRSRKPGL